MVQRMNSSIKDKNSIASLAIEISTKAFLPEAYVYNEMFNRKGVRSEIVISNKYNSTDYDAVVLFHGFHPFWNTYPKVVISEYHSLSVGMLSRLKDTIKRLLNVRGDYYIVLNELVRDKLWLKRTQNLSIRGMGFHKSNDKKCGPPKEFDIVYCGSERDGLYEVLQKFSRMGLKVAVVGLSQRIEYPNIINFGKVSHERAYDVMQTSRLGLNYTPNIFPLNVQDSTKVIEYCGLGLGVVTTDYQWVRSFERARGGRFLYLNEVKGPQDVSSFEYIVPDVTDLEWRRLSEKLFNELKSSLNFDIS